MKLRNNKPETLSAYKCLLSFSQPSPFSDNCYFWHVVIKEQNTGTVSKLNTEYERSGCDSFPKVSTFKWLGQKSLQKFRLIFGRFEDTKMSL